MTVPEDYVGTLILIKPDAMAKDLAPQIEDRFRREGLIVRRRTTYDPTPEELIRAHYAEHEGRDYYEPLVAFMRSGPVMAIELDGHNAVERARKIIGHRDWTQAEVGTIRRDFGPGESPQANLVHGSDSLASARRELALWFPSGPLNNSERQELINTSHA